MESDTPTGITKIAIRLFDGMFVHTRWGTFIAWGIFTRSCMIHISDIAISKKVVPPLPASFKKLITF